MGNKIKVTGTKVGADGTGYFRGNDGNYYYGNPQNGYLTKTKQSQRAQSQAAAPSCASSGGSSGGGGDCGVGIIEGLLAGAISAVVAAGMIATLFIALALSVTMLWPQYISQLAGYYQRGQADLMVVIMSAVIVFLIGYFLISAVRVLQTKQMRSRRYMVVCIVAMTVPAIPVGIFIGSPGMIPLFALNAIAMSVLPAFLLCFIEHIATKTIRGDKEWFITKIARLVNRVFPFHSTGMKIFGVLVILFSGLTKFAFDLTQVPDESDVLRPIAFLITGILLIAAGIVSKKKEGR